MELSKEQFLKLPEKYKSCFVEVSGENKTNSHPT